MLRVLIISVSLVIGSGHSGLSRAEETRLPALPPKDNFYRAPSPDVPKELASLLGVWEGDWSNGTNTFLIVEKVDLKKARIIYGRGTNPPRRNKRSHTRRIAKVRVIDGLPSLQFPSRRGDFLFRLSSDLRTLSGSYRKGSIELKKTDAPVFDRAGSFYVPPKLRTVAFVNVNVVPIDKNRVLASQTVIVQDGRIAQIGTEGQVSIPKSAEIVQGNGKAFLMPGLADMHVHILDGNDLRLLIVNGVTTVRNMAGVDRHLLFREDVNEGIRIGPTIYSAGPILDGNPPVWPFNRVIETPQEARQAVIETKERGFDFVKVYTRLGLEAYAAIVDTANQNEMPVVGHVPVKVGFSSVVKAGQYSVEHLNGADYALAKDSDYNPGFFGRWNLDFDPTRLDDYLIMTVKAGLWNCPTLTIYKPRQESLDVLLQTPGLKYFPDARKDRWQIQIEPKENSEKRKYLVSRLHKAGARLLLGTDTSVRLIPYGIIGFSIHDELERFVDIGLTPYEAIKTGTYNAAQFMNKLDQFGTVETGKEADLILVRGNPLENLANIKNPLGVMAKGRWYPQSLLEKILKDVEKEVTEQNKAPIQHLLLQRDG